MGSEAPSSRPLLTTFDMRCRSCSSLGRHETPQANKIIEGSCWSSSYSRGVLPSGYRGPVLERLGEVVLAARAVKFCVHHRQNQGECSVDISTHPSGRTSHRWQHRTLRRQSSVGVLEEERRCSELHREESERCITEMDFSPWIQLSEIGN